MGTSTTETLSRKKILLEAERVISSQKVVFFQLSLIFLFPLSATISLYLFLRNTVVSKQITNDIVLALLTYLVALVFSTCGIGSITFAAFKGFNDEPVELSAAIKSIPASFFPLLATTLVSQVTVFGPTLVFATLASVLGFSHINYFVVFFALVLIAIAAYFQLNWLLAYPVVVVESKWGFEALKRSQALIDGNKRPAFQMILIFGLYYFYLNFFIWHGIGAGSISDILIDETVDTDTKIYFLKMIILLILVCACYLTICQLNVVVTTTVLYGSYKKSQLGDEHVSSPVNDERVPLIV